MELVLVKTDEGSLEDPSSTAIPFAHHAQAARGNGKTGKERKKRLKGIRDTD